MDDKELLEFAAKAAGYRVQGWINDKLYVHDDSSGDSCPFVWTSMDDDGDALRLAVNRRFKIVFWRDGKTVAIYEDQDSAGPICFEPCGDEPAKATRRAITRAAAQVWRSKGK